MAMKNWKTKSALQSIVVSPEGSSNFIMSSMYPGTYILEGGIVLPSNPLVLFANGELLTKSIMNVNSANFGSIEEHGLLEGQWDWRVNENELITLNNVDKSRWASTSSANIYYYNNLDATADPKVPVKPTRMVRYGKVLIEAFSKLTTKTVGSTTYPALDPNNLPVDGEWVWALDPTDSYMTIYLFNNEDPDNSVANSFSYDNGNLGHTVYVRLDRDPDTVEITKPGDIVKLVPTVESGKRVLLTNITLYNGDDVNSEITLAVENSAEEVSFYRENLVAKKSYFIDSTMVLNAGDSLKIYSDNKLVSAIVTGDEA